MILRKQSAKQNQFVVVCVDELEEYVRETPKDICLHEVGIGNAEMKVGIDFDKKVAGDIDEA